MHDFVLASVCNGICVHIPQKCMIHRPNKMPAFREARLALSGGGWWLSPSSFRWVHEILNAFSIDILIQAKLGWAAAYGFGAARRCFKVVQIGVALHNGVEVEQFLAREFSATFFCFLFKVCDLKASR